MSAVELDLGDELENERPAPKPAAPARARHATLLFDEEFQDDFVAEETCDAVDAEPEHHAERSAAVTADDWAPHEAVVVDEADLDDVDDAPPPRRARSEDPVDDPGTVAAEPQVPVAEVAPLRVAPADVPAHDAVAMAEPVAAAAVVETDPVAATVVEPEPWVDPATVEPEAVVEPEPVAEIHDLFATDEDNAVAEPVADAQPRGGGDDFADMHVGTEVDPTSGENVWSGGDPSTDIWEAAPTHRSDDDEPAAEESEEPVAAEEPTPKKKRKRKTKPLDDEVAELNRIIEEELVTMMYQPITSLLDNSVVGYEALARGPEDSKLATPAAMFAAAEAAGRLNELDLLCQKEAVVQARDVLLKSGHALFVNVEPSVIADAAFGRDEDALESLSSLLSNMTAACPVVLEISDRHPYDSVAEMLGIVMWARSHGFRIALDDVSVNPQSLALLPILEPDVIKLDRWVLNADPDADLGLLLNVVRVQAERTGAAVVAQGIESPEDRELAHAFGATHIQGFGVGLPTELSDAPLRIRSLEPVRASYAESAVSPFDLVASSMARRTGTAGVIQALTLDFERQAAEHGDAIILSNFEYGTTDTDAIARRYEKLATVSPFVVALGEGIDNMENAYSGGAEQNDPLYAERAIVVLSPHFAVALLARRTGGIGAGDEFTFTVTYDRGLVTRAARMLIAHIDA